MTYRPRKFAEAAWELIPLHCCGRGQPRTGESGQLKGPTRRRALLLSWLPDVHKLGPPVVAAWCKRPAEMASVRGRTENHRCIEPHQPKRIGHSVTHRHRATSADNEVEIETRIDWSATGSRRDPPLVDRLDADRRLNA